jgi:NADPH:quinone reductase-like Zn-dependent oxidoreductase
VEDEIMTPSSPEPAAASPLPITARAVRLTGEASIEALSFDQIPCPPPGPGQVLVAIQAVALNFRDLLVVSGKYSPNLPRPLIVASDGAGEVIALGEQVTRFKLGDRVAGAFFQNWVDGDFHSEVGRSALGGAIDGVLTSARVFDERGLVHLPPHLSYAEGATLPCAALTAWHALVTTAHVKSGDSVLLLGTGGVSIFGLQFAKLHGARVILTSSSDEKLARALSLGADELINYQKTPEWRKEVLRLTAGKGADIVLEVGGAGTLAQSLGSVRAGGQISLVGNLAGLSDTLNIAPILHRSIRLQGIFVGSVEMFETMNRAIALHRLKPVIDRVFPYHQSREALRHMQDRGHFGKIVISVSE